MNRSSKALMWSTGSVAAAVIALTTFAVLTAEDDTAAPKNPAGSTAAASPGSPAPLYSAPDDWTEPERWATLPRGKRTDDNGNEVGFPHTTEGAVAMLVATQSHVVEGDRNVIDEHMGVFDSYMASADKTEKKAKNVESLARETDAKMRRQMRLNAEVDDLPPGAYMRTAVVGFQVIEESENEVSLWMLTRATMKGGETQKENISFARSLAAAAWEDGDWKLSSAAIIRAYEGTKGSAKPKMAVPGDAVFNDAGWTAIREAS